MGPDKGHLRLALTAATGLYGSWPTQPDAIASRKILKGLPGLFRLVGYMDEKSLEQLLRQRGDAIRSRSLPSNFRQNVWRQIRLGAAAETSAFRAFFGWQCLLRPQFVTAMLALAMLVGVGVGSRSSDRVALSTKQALNLDVFGATPPTLPSTVLAAEL